MINESKKVIGLRSTHPEGEYYDISTFHIWK